MTRNSSKADGEAPETAWSRLEPLLDAVLLETGAARRRRALELTREDPALRSELLHFLDSAEASECFLGQGVAESWPELLAGLESEPDRDRAQPPSADGAGLRDAGAGRQGEVLGVYRLEGLLGRGGMGEVYRARRADGAFERQVAIKIARAHRGGDAALERFRVEQQILAELDHPHIAGLLDAGLTPDGVPFAVMEYVEGRPIDRQARGLGIEKRLGLFLEVCDAVDHAHRRLVIHRDLKPGNILVDAAGQAKLLDFGIATLLDPQSGASEDAGTLYLTPEYAAPEQFLRGRLSIATDVYALGAILFELLASRPLRRFTVDSTPLSMRTITDAPRPSEVCEDPRTARRLLGDLDAIVRRALETEPEDRYPSVRALAEDIERHLDARPVDARGSGRLYRAGKMIRRHWLGLGLGAVVFLLLLGSTITALRHSRAAEREQAKALDSAQRAERVSSFLVELFDTWDPYRFEHGDVSARDLLDLGAERARGGLGEAPQARFDLLVTLGEVYLRLGLMEESRRLLEDLSRADSPRSGFEQARVLLLRARIHEETGAPGDAEPLLTLGLRRLDEDAGAANPRSARLRCDLLINHGDVLNLLGRYDDAARQLERALALARRLGLPDREAASLASLASSGHGGQDHDVDRLREALEIYRSLEVERPQELRSTLNNLAIYQINHGAWDEAAASLEELIDLDLESLGDDHPFRAASLVNLARLRIEQGRFEGALDLLERAETVLKANDVAPNSPERLALEMSRGRALAELGRPRALERLFETRTLFLETFGEDHAWRPAIEARIAEAALRLGRVQTALDFSRRALADMSEENPRRPETELVEGAALGALGRCDEALPRLESGAEHLLRTLPPEAWRLDWARLELHACRGGAPLDPAIASRLEAVRGAENPLSRRARQMATAEPG